LVLAAAVLPLILGQQATVSTTQDFASPGDLYNVTGLRAIETGENGQFRWGGSLVTMQMQPLGWPLYSTLHVQGVRPDGEPLAQVGAEAYGKSLGVQEIPRTPSTLEYRLPVASLFSINPQLTLTSTVFQAPGDNRELGIVYYSLDERSGSFPSLPSAWPAIWLILSVLLTYMGMRTLSQIGDNSVSKPTRRLLDVPTLTAIALGAIIGILNATERPWLVFYSLYFIVPPLVLLFVTPWLRTLAGQNRQHAETHDSDVGSSPAIADRSLRVAIAVVTLALALMIWHVFAPVEPGGDDPTHNLSWGVSFYSTLPTWVQALGVIVVVGAIAWAWFAPFTIATKAAQEEEERGSNDGNRSTTDSFVFRLSRALRENPQYAIPIVGMVVFALLPVAYSEGDSSEFDSRISIGAIWRERELLDFYIKVKLWRWLEPIFKLPSDIYQIMAVLAGGIYLAAANLLGRTLGRSRLDTLVIVGALAAIGNIVLFFRYVESYALVTAASLFVLWACWRYTEGGLSFGAVGALATLAPFIHGSALWWGPMVAAAWLLRALQLPRIERWRRALADLRDGVGVGLAIVLVIVSIMIVDTYDFERFQVGLGEMGGRDGRTLLPLFTTVSPTEHYAFFSWPHLGAVVQEQLLTAPMALATIGLMLILAWGWVRALARRTPALVTMGVGAASMLFYSIAWNPDLGPRNDWDLLGLPALPLTLVAVYLLLQLPQGKPRRLALTAYLAVSAVHSAAWVLVHVAGVTG
jgi:hypothetical protein